MARRLAHLPVLLLVLFPVPGGAGRAEEDASLPARVNRAIDRATVHLLGQQGKGGAWGKDDLVHPLGRTALCTYALLHAGLAPDHPAVRRALGALGVREGSARGLRPRSTYEASCIVFLLDALGPRHGATIREICQWLCDRFDRNEGLWGYPQGTPDLSNTQYAVLALRAGARHGFAVPRSIWKRLLDSVLFLQSDHGAFRYRPGTIYRATMTHAGLLVLQVALEGLEMPRAPRRVREAMARGHAWLDAQFDAEHATHGRGWHVGHYYYYLYGLERYAVLFDRRRIGDRNWYREGAEALLARQRDDGSWGELADTAFAILFLRRATLTAPRAREGVGGAPTRTEHAPKPPEPPRPKASVPFVRAWLVAGPYPGAEHEDDHLFTRHLDVGRVRPRAGAPAGDRRWERYMSDEDTVDLGAALGHRAWASYYLAAWIHARADADVVLWLGSDDGLRAYLDGEEILYGHHHGDSGPDHYRVLLPLTAGRHLLLVHLENLERDVLLRARVTDREGRRPEGVAVTTAPQSPFGRGAER